MINKNINIMIGDYIECNTKFFLDEIDSKGIIIKVNRIGNNLGNRINYKSINNKRFTISRKYILIIKRNGVEL